MYRYGSARRQPGEVVGALHLHQPRDGALEFEAAVALDVYFLRRRLGRDDEQRVRLVERVDQDVKTLRLVAPLRRQAWNALDEDRRVALDQRQVIDCRQRPGAQFRKREPS